MSDASPEEPLAEGHARFLSAWIPYRPRLYHLCLRWVGGRPEDAEEAMSRVSLHALEQPPGAAISSVRAWLTRLARNTCNDLHRERASLLKKLDGLAQDAPPDAAAEDAESEYLKKELDLALHHAIGVLPARLRAPCELRFLDEMPHDDIARDLGLTCETVRKRIQEGRALLKEDAAAYLEGLQK